MCDVAPPTGTSVPSEDKAAPSVTDSVCEPPSITRARFLKFTSFTLLRSVLRIKFSSRIGLFQECTQVPPESTRSIQLVVPLHSGEPIFLADDKAGHILLQFNLSEIVACSKGTSAQTNRYFMFIIVDPDSPAEEPSSNPCSTDSSPDDLLISPKYHGFRSDRLCHVHVIRCTTTYEAGRLFRLMSEMLMGKTGEEESFFSAAPEFGSLRLRLLIDVREEDKSTEGEWKSVPKEKSNVFKFRQRNAKRLVIGFTQYSGIASVSVASVMNISVNYGRYLPDHELTWLGPCADEFHGDAASSQMPGATFLATCKWPSGNPELDAFETLTNKDECIFFTVTVKVVLTNVAQPLVLGRVCRARVFRQDEIFWPMTDRKPVVQDYTLHLSEFVDHQSTLLVGRFAEVVRVAPTSFSPPSVNTAVAESAADLPDSSSPGSQLLDEEADEANEPLLSGHGVVSQEIADDGILNDWGSLIGEWQAKVRQSRLPGSLPILHPTPVSDENRLLNGTIGPSLNNSASNYLGSALCQRIRRLVNVGIPDALRAEVWQLLTSSAVRESDLMDVYRILITKPCKHDEAIRRDLARTFPAHDFFRDHVGQEYLFQVGRAYALYDEEVGYCQGLSFFAAVLLLHMPVEQAFSLLIQVNNNYGLRELFLHDFDGLHMRLYQLERIVQDQLPDLARHFSDLHVEPHMYASQWFLTLFTSKFPLPLVYRIVDLFLTEGLIFIFKVAFSLLRMARRDLLGLDFEGVLKHLRATLPKRFMDPDLANELLTAAISAKITPLKMLKYARDWNSSKINRRATGSVEQQVALLRKQVARLEHENKLLASGLLSSKASMHQEVDKLEDKAESLTRELFSSRNDLQNALEENAHLLSEVAQIKQMLRVTMEQASQEQARQQSLIATYRAVTSDLLKRCDSRSVHPGNGSVRTDGVGDASMLLYLRLLGVLLAQVSTCTNCLPVLEESVDDWRRTNISVRESEESVDEYVTQFMSGADSEPRPDDGQSSSSRKSSTGSNSPSTGMMRSLRTKKWLANTLNALRTMSIGEVATLSSMNEHKAK